MLLFECFDNYNYAVIPLDDTCIYHGVKSVHFMPFKTFRECVYYCRHFVRQSIYYCAHDPFSGDLFEKPCLHFVIVKCSFWGLSVKDHYNIYFDVDGDFSSVYHNVWG